MKSVFDKLTIGIVLLALALTGTLCSGSTHPSTHQLTASPTSVNFGSLALNSTITQTITLTNTGTGVLQIQNVALSGSSAFAVTGWSGQMSLQPSGSLQLGIRFTPTAPTSYSGFLTVSSNAQSDEVVALAGAGAARGE